jgi:hypothetical protein
VRGAEGLWVSRIVSGFKVGKIKGLGKMMVMLGPGICAKGCPPKSVKAREWRCWVRGFLCKGVGNVM